MTPEETAKDAQRNILLNWTMLSAGDVSVVQAVLSRPDDAIVTTVPGTPHAQFWAQLVRLNWAQETQLPPEMAALPVDLECYRLTGVGKAVVPAFMARWKLFEITANNNAPKDKKPPGRFLTGYSASDC